MTLTDEQIRQKFEEAVEKPSLSIFWNEKIGRYMSVHIPRKAEEYNLMYENFCSGFKAAISLQGEAVPIETGFPIGLEMPKELNNHTKALVVLFAQALAQKLFKAEQKYGYSDGWMADDWLDECRQKLHEHIDKGDPLDVTAYCAFLWHHGSYTYYHPIAIPVRTSPPLTTAQQSELDTKRFDILIQLLSEYNLHKCKWGFTFFPKSFDGKPIVSSFYENPRNLLDAVILALLPEEERG